MPVQPAIRQLAMKAGDPRAEPGVTRQALHTNARRARRSESERPPGRQGRQSVVPGGGPAQTSA